MNAIGIGAAVVFCVAAIGALVTFFVFDLATLLRENRGRVWNNPVVRGRFLSFVAFCALGPLSAVAGILFGSWPTGHQ